MNLSHAPGNTPGTIRDLHRDLPMNPLNVGDYVKHTADGRQGKVIEIDGERNRYRIKWPDKRTWIARAYLTKYGVSQEERTDEPT